MLRVGAGERSATLRLARPGAFVAFAKRDVVVPGYEDAVRAARAEGFEAVVRLAGGRAAIFAERSAERKPRAVRGPLGASEAQPLVG